VGKRVAGLLGTILGKAFSQAGTAWKLLPERHQREVLARLNDINPWAAVNGDAELCRAARIAWADTALHVMDVAERQHAAERAAEAGLAAYLDRARPAVKALRSAAFDRRGTPAPSPVDGHLDGLLRGAGERAPATAPGPAGFAGTLAELTGETTPDLLATLAEDGLDDGVGGPCRSFAEELADRFADQLKRDPKAGTAFDINMALANRALLEKVAAASRDLDDTFATSLAAERTHIAALFEASNERWHGIRLNPGTASLAQEATLIANRPSWLVVARYRVVPFLDRDRVLAEALAWALGGPLRAQGRLYVAPGGAGKTRLAIELVAELAAMGWRCGFLSSANVDTPQLGPLAQLMQPSDAPGVLLVLDYAESQAERLRQVAHAANQAPEGVPIRLLALARSAEGWWKPALDEPDTAAVFEPAARLAVEAPLSDHDRATLYADALARFQAALTAAGHAPVLPASRPSLAGPAYARPLAVAMAAYLAARGTAVEGGSVLAHMYGEERRHWRRALGGVADTDPRVTTLHRLAAQVTLVQGATREGAAALIQADPRGAGLHASEREAALAVAETLYGIRDGEAVWLRPVEPDLLGENVIATLIQSDDTEWISIVFDMTLNERHMNVMNSIVVLSILARTLKNQPISDDIRLSILNQIRIMLSKIDRTTVNRIIQYESDNAFVINDTINNIIADIFEDLTSIKYKLIQKLLSASYYIISDIQSLLDRIRGFITLFQSDRIVTRSMSAAPITTWVSRDIVFLIESSPTYQINIGDIDNFSSSQGLSR